MSQSYDDSTATYSVATAINTKVVNSLKALRSFFSGSSAPGTTIRVACMPWFDTSTNEFKVRNVGDTAWQSIDRIVVKEDERGWSAAAFTVFLMPPTLACRLEGIRIVSTTATTGSSDGVTDYEFDVYNVTDSHSLFSAQPGTGNSVGGVGGGEIAANTVYELTPDQNDGVTADDVLEFRVTVNGSPTSLTRVAVYSSWVQTHA